MDKNYEVYLVVIPGLEEVAIEELERRRKRLDIYQSISNEGLVLKSENLFNLLEFVVELRIPTKALLRIEQFVARDLPKLYKKLQKINWNNYIPTKDYAIKVSSKSSRLFDERKIIKTSRDAISAYQVAQPYKKKYDDIKWEKEPTIHLRFIDDQCQISIDCSGERLDKRGVKLLSAKAPMRESIAAAFVQFINESKIKYNLLVDPMAGSGTIISEYFRQDTRNDLRDFNFRNFPLYRKFPAVKIDKPLVHEHKALAADIDGKNLMAIKENLSHYITEGNLEVKEIDFFKTKELPKGSILACNLPYGKRIKTRSDDIHKFVNEFLEKADSLKVKAAFIVLPETFIIDKKRFNITRSERINNGGIWIQFIKVLF